MKYILKIFLLISFLFFSLSPAIAQPVRPAPQQLQAILQKFEKYAEREMPKWKIPGMAVAVVQGDKIIYRKAFGVKTVGQKDPVTIDTLFQIGSTSKAFTTALVAMLADEGKIKWDDPVISHLPDFKMYDPWVTEQFMIEDLMAQRSGMPSHAGDTLSFFLFDREYIRDSVRFIKPVSSFRSRFAYQNTLFLVAAELVEKKTGKTWEENVYQRIFRPLGMNDSSIDSRTFQRSSDVTSLHIEEEGQIKALPRDWKYLDWSYIYAPAGGIDSNITDMSKWLRLQMHGGSFKGKELVSQKKLEFLHTPKIPALTEPGIKEYYCQGWIYREYCPHSIIWHNGGTIGCKTMIAFIPQDEIGIVVLSNLITDLPDSLAFRFFDLYYGKPDRDWSAEHLVKVREAKEKEKAAMPKRPASPTPPLALASYAGRYKNEVYGTIDLTVQNGALEISIGPKKFKMTLDHIDKDTFAVSLPEFTNEFGFAEFDVDPRDRVTGLTLSSLNNDGCGVFKKI